MVPVADPYPPGYKTGMDIPAVKYLHWAKTRPRVKYDLAGSGVPQIGWAELGISPDDMSLGIEGTYGHPELIALLSDRYGVDRSRILPVPGTSAANFIALACVVVGPTLASI